MEKKDCFAYISRDKYSGCFALNERVCENCVFYKHSDDPQKTRDQILKEIALPWVARRN